MVKTPKTRHSKLRRDPVTIDLEPEEVSRVEEPNPADENDAARADAASDGPLLDSERADEGLADEVLAKEAAAEETPTEPAADDRNALDEDVRARTHAEPRYAAGFGRSPDATDYDTDPEQEEPELESSPVGSGRRSGLAAGLVGGLLALVGAGGLQFAGLLPSPGNDGNPNIAGLQVEIDALRQEIDRLKNVSGTTGEQRFDGLVTTVDQLKSDLAGLRNAVEAGGAGDGAAVQALDDKLKEIETAVAALGESGSGASTKALDAISQKIASVEGALDTASKAAAAADARLARLEQNVAGLSQEIEAQADQPRIALAIAASGLKAAIERGGPFAAEVETFAAVAPNASELAELRALAEQGVPSRADLVAAAPGAAIAMIDASKDIDDNAGFFEQLMSSAESLVTVRPIGAVEGEGVPEKVARMEAALKDGNLARALAEYDTLPGPPKAAGAGFADTIRRRLKAEEMVDKALAGALKAG